MRASCAGQILHSVANGSPCFNIYTQVAMLPWRYNAEMGTAHPLHASAQYGEYNKRFGFGTVESQVMAKQK